MSIKKLDLTGEVKIVDGEIQLNMNGSINEMLIFSLRLQSMIVQEAARYQAEEKNEPFGVQMVMMSKYMSERTNDFHDHCVQKLVADLLDDEEIPTV